MSEHTPITGNLRQAMVQWGWADGREVTITDLQPSIDAEPFLTIRGGRFGELCDAIDAIHANLERENAALKEELDRVHGEQEEAEHRGWTRGYDEGFASADDWLGQHEEAMVEHGWVRLPKDADGEYIHIGDRVENNERVVRIVLTDDSWEPSVYIEKLPNVLHEHFCNEISHYHAPTVEDVLRDFGVDIAHALDADQDATVPEAIIAEYAKRLTLVEMED
jgi:hypothetical protein